jgi:hypothetical protein
MGGFTLVEDIAAAVSFLGSGEARRITGTRLIVDGGLIGCDTYHVVPQTGARRNPPSADSEAAP